MYKFDVAQTIGEIIEIMPYAVEILMKYDIDIYLHEGDSLNEVIEEKKLNESEVINKLNDIYNFNELRKLKKLSSSELVDYIINKHHSYVMNNLDRASYLTEKVYKACGPSYQNIVCIHRVVHDFKSNLERLLIKEATLFKNIKDYEKSLDHERVRGITLLINEVGSELGLVDTTLKDIKEISRNCRIPRDEFASYWSIVKAIEEIKKDLLYKTYLKNDLLFKAIDY